MIKLASIRTYPVKSLGALTHDEILLRAGKGMAGDRAWGIASGALPIPDAGDWTRCQAFRRLTVDPVMNGWTLVERDGVLHIATGEGTITLPRSADALAPSEEAQTSLADRMGPGARFVRARTGWWDHRDGALSIINLDTLAEIERVVGLPMPPERFRANLYINAPPWSELGLVGKRITMGTAELDVFRPIDRCRATSLLPGQTTVDGNVPALLMRHFGHIYCGVYARVARSGPINVGDCLTATGTAPSGTIEAAAVDTAPPIAQWPRLAEVLSNVSESCDTRSVWLRDPFGDAGALEAYRPGQHLRIHRLDENASWRSYTISAVEGERLRLTVRAGGGVGSQAVHDWAVGEYVAVSGPSGDFVMPYGQRPLFLISAGIGVTPMVAVLRQDHSGDRPVHAIHVLRERANAPLLRELEELVAAAAGTLSVFETGMSGNGRPDWPAISKHVATVGGQAMICGPAGFTADVAAALTDAGVNTADVRHEVFTTPALETDLRAPSSPGPFNVTFSESGLQVEWTASDGTLLDLAEARGLLPPSHCRAGACGTCRAKLRTGRAEHLIGQRKREGDLVLTCCAVPLSDVTIDWVG